MIRVGIAGIGFMGVTHFKAYEKVEGAEVRAICTRSPKKLQGDWTDIQGNFGGSGGVQDLTGIRKYSELEQLLADPDLDLIDVCLPSQRHKDVAIAAMQHGKHVIVEKPIALNLADADAAVRVAEETGRVLTVGQVLRFFPEFALIKQIADGGEYGPIYAAHFKRMIASTWFEDPTKTGNTVSELYIHDADFVRYLFGMPAAVNATAFRGQSGDAAFLQAQYYYADQNLCVTANSGSIAMPELQFEHGYDVYFEKATMRFNSTWGETVTLYTRDKQKIALELPFDDAFQAELQYVVSAIENGVAPVALSGQSARDSLYLCDKTQESIDKGEIISV